MNKPGFFQNIVERARILVKPERDQYDRDEVLTVQLKDLSGKERRARFQIIRSVGGGYACQVYRALLMEISPPAPDLEPGREYAIKFFIPPGSFRRRFRGLLFFLGFQSQFSLRANEDAVVCGQIWQELIRRGAHVRFGSPDAVVRPHGIFFDQRLKTYAEVNEWVPGRLSRMQADKGIVPRLLRTLRNRFLRGDRKPELPAPDSELSQKRRFMERLVVLFEEMGAVELTRQYLWWTCKSQPNVLRRRDISESSCGETEGHVAIDFRSGMTMLPFLPLSPADPGFIRKGLRRGALVQFDRADFSRLDQFMTQHPEAFVGLEMLVEELKARDERYRRSMPDITHHRLRLLTDPGLRKTIRHQTITAWEKQAQISTHTGEKLRGATGRYLFYLALSMIPVLGRKLLRYLGDTIYQVHIRCIFSDARYRADYLEMKAASDLDAWARAGRVSELRALCLFQRRSGYWRHKLLLAWLPSSVHRVLSDPKHLVERVRDVTLRVWRFIRDPAWRTGWLCEKIEAAVAEGTLEPREAEALVDSLDAPWLNRYMVDMSVSVLLKPTSQMAYLLLTGYASITGDFVPLVILCASPISVSGTLRTMYILMRSVHFRDYQAYRTAMWISPFKGIGAFALPLQMVRAYPVLSMLIGSNLISRAVTRVPVFGERGALLEHLMFNCCYNVPLSVHAMLTSTAQEQAPRISAAASFSPPHMPLETPQAFSPPKPHDDAKDGAHDFSARYRATMPLSVSNPESGDGAE